MRLAREFFFIPIILLIFTFIVSDAYGFIYGKFASILFPTDSSVAQISKMYITAVIGYMALEYFVLSTLPNNYLFSRMLGMISMMSLYIIFSTYYDLKTINHLFIILSGSLVSYMTQSIGEIKGQNYLGLFLLIFAFSYLTVIST